MISVYYIDKKEDHFNLTNKNDVIRFINQSGCPTSVILSGYELSIISNWKNIPITNNVTCAWTGDMAWFIVMNLVTTMKQLERQAND